MNNKDIPYETLDPAVILDAVESVGFRCDGSLSALNSFENRVYQVGIDNAAPWIVKFYRPHRWSDDAILEEHQFALELSNLEIPVVAPWVDDKGRSLHQYNEFRFALFPKWGGRALELDNSEQLEWIGRFIGRLHAMGSYHPFKYRARLDVKTYGYAAYQFLMENNFIPDYLKTNYFRVAEEALMKVQQAFDQVDRVSYIRLHGDLHAGNILWNNAGPHIVDLDDCMMGPAIQDIWMLLSGDQSQMDAHLGYILNGYEEFHDFNYAEIHLIEALRTLRQIHYSAWLARRWEDPAFPLNFPWFNTPRYWEERMQDLQRQIEGMGHFSNSDEY